MKKKDRRVRLFLELFFLAAGLYVLLFKAWDVFTSAYPGNMFESQNGIIPVFMLAAHVFTGLACFISGWALWSRVTWDAGWSIFTFGLLLYGNLHSIGANISDSPAKTIPMIIIVLIVLQSFPFLMRESGRYP